MDVEKGRVGAETQGQEESKSHCGTLGNVSWGCEAYTEDQEAGRVACIL